MMCLSSKYIDCLNPSGQEIVKEEIHCLSNNIVYRLIFATSKSITYTREQMFRLYTTEIVLFRDLIMR